MEDPRTVQVLREAISNRVVNLECPFCGSREWFHNEDRVNLLYPAVRVENRLIPTGEPDFAIGFICERCGFTRFHVPANPVPE
jgi:predicted RNA-binding Zn-ribbon protein involved in translation (DUF1610 family)